MRLGFRWPRMTDDMCRLVKLGIFSAISGGGVTQINIAIGTVIVAAAGRPYRSFIMRRSVLYELPVKPAEAIDSLYNYAVRMGADAVINFSTSF